MLHCFQACLRCDFSWVEPLPHVPALPGLCMPQCQQVLMNGPTAPTREELPVQWRQGGIRRCHCMQGFWVLEVSHQTAVSTKSMAPRLQLSCCLP